MSADETMPPWAEDKQWVEMQNAIKNNPIPCHLTFQEMYPDGSCEIGICPEPESIATHVLCPIKVWRESFK